MYCRNVFSFEITHSDYVQLLTGKHCHLRFFIEESQVLMTLTVQLPIFYAVKTFLISAGAD